MTEIKALPPLPLPTVKRLQDVEAWTRKALSDCGYPGTKMLDERKTLEVMRAALVEELDIRLDHYETLPEYDWDWSHAIGSHASIAVLACFPVNYYEKRDEKNILVAYEQDSQFLDELVRTAWDHMVARRLAYGKKQSDPLVSLEDRKALVKAYRSRFPEVAIIDICWAAKQHRREWDRWFKNELPDDSRPDRAFRLVLQSAKPATDLRKGRPKEWK